MLNIIKYQNTMRSEIQSAPVLSLELLSTTERNLLGPQRESGFHSKIIRTLPDLIWLKNSVGAYLACNHRFEDFIGASEQEIFGKIDYDLMNSKLADLFREHDKKVMLKGSLSINKEWIIFANDGHRELLEISRLPMYDDTGELIGVLGIGRNVTAHKESEQALKEREERFSFAMRGANDGLWDWNLETRRSLLFPTLEKYAGLWRRTN